MAQHYGEEYVERDIKSVADRFCLNRRESLETGDDRVFAIVWRNGHVFKRVIKGGPVINPKQERGFLICPGGLHHRHPDGCRRQSGRRVYRLLIRRSGSATS